jgi:DNA-binding ferritin-like protein
MSIKLIELDAVLRIYEQNFRNLHWNSKGIEFNDSHKNITTEYYEMIAADVDKVAELLAIMGIDPFNYLEAAEYVTKSEVKYFIVDSKTHYSKLEICKFADIMLNDICTILSAAIEEITDPINAGIRSELETLLFKYTLEARYLNKRRIEE